MSKYTGKTASAEIEGWIALMWKRTGWLGERVKLPPKQFEFYRKALGLREGAKAFTFHSVLFAVSFEAADV